MSSVRIWLPRLSFERARTTAHNTSVIRLWKSGFDSLRMQQLTVANRDHTKNKLSMMVNTGYLICWCPSEDYPYDIVVGS